MSDDRLIRVNKIIQDYLGVDPEKIVPEASFQDDLGCDSLDNVELVMCLEEEFGIEIWDEQAEKFQTVKHVHDFILDNVAA